MQAALLLAIAFAGFPKAEARETRQCRVVSVHDGDSMRVQCPGERKSIRVRMGGIDAPELDQAYGRQARDHLRRLCPSKTVATLHTQDIDQYGRVVGSVYCQGKSVNQEMVGSGFAWVYDHHVDKDRAEDGKLYSLQVTARAEKRGLWAGKNPEAPWRWRHRQRQGSNTD